MSPTSNAPSEPPARLVIVVPRPDTKLYAYLQRSFSQASNIEVVLDRRATPAAASPATSPDLRRRSGARSILGGLTIASAGPRPGGSVAKDPPAPAVPPSRPRLWPTLRPKDFTLVIPEADPNREGR